MQLLASVIASSGDRHRTQQEIPVLHPSWNEAPKELRQAAQEIEAHRLAVFIGCSYENLEHAAENLLRDPQKFWKELEEDALLYP